MPRKPAKKRTFNGWDITMMILFGGLGLGAIGFAAIMVWLVSILPAY